MMQTAGAPITSEEVKVQARQFGFDLAGVCRADQPPHYAHYRRWLEKGYQGSMAYLEEHLPLKAHPEQLLPGCRSVIMVALNYNQPSERAHGHPRIARYALGRDYHKVLRGKLRRLATWIQQNAPDQRTRACVDSAPIMERDFAQLAGLGWYGKNTMIINSQRGSWFFLGALLTTLELTPDEPAVGGCGTCRRCIEACPTGAILFEEDRWQIDARRCISYLTIEHEGPLEHDTDGWTFGCDVCQEVCPFNEARDSQPLRAQATTEADFLNRSRMPDLATLANVDWGAWDEITRGSPIRRAGIEGLRRNARANLESLRILDAEASNT
jgi:epoxyqueuosine reductase